MPSLIRRLLCAAPTVILARALLTLPCWGSGLDKLFNFAGAQDEMRMFSLEPAAFFAALTIVTQLGGSVAVITGRGAWLGAGALGVFTALTIPIAHAFWRMSGPEAIVHFHFVVEHLGMIGGLLAAAILSAMSRPATVAFPRREPAALAG